MAALLYSRPILMKLNTKFRTSYKVVFPSVGGYKLKNTEDITCFILFSHQFFDRSLSKPKAWYQLLWNRIS